MERFEYTLIMPDGIRTSPGVKTTPTDLFLSFLNASRKDTSVDLTWGKNKFYTAYFHDNEEFNTFKQLVEKHNFDVNFNNKFNELIK